MQNEIIMTAKTVDEALERAYEEMGATSDESSFEILQMPKRDFSACATYLPRCASTASRPRSRQSR